MRGTLTAVETSAFCFASDLADEGVEQVLENLQVRAGLGGATMAAAYHAARDVFPHAARRHLRFQRGGEVFFAPAPARWRGLAVKPRVSELVADGDPLRGLVEACVRRGMAARAWTVFLHVDWTEDGDPRFAEQTCFGDPCLTELCPANPDVRAYAVALAADVSATGVQDVLAESLHFHGLEHGAHHERYFVEPGSVGRLLLGLCFCEHCVVAAAAFGVDGAELRRRACALVERAFAGAQAVSTDELSRDQAEALLGGQLGGYLAARLATVSSLVHEVAAATREAGSRLVYMDSSGAAKGYASGLPQGGPAPELAWRFGTDVAAVAEACGALEAIAYAADPARVELDLAAYRELAPSAALSAALRPAPPDCTDSANLAAKLRVASAVGVERVDFYHYGLAPLSALDLIGRALTKKSAPNVPDPNGA